jgi:ABC-type multidrug transport system fused ATPase/permease subunit
MPHRWDYDDEYDRHAERRRKAQEQAKVVEGKAFTTSVERDSFRAEREAEESGDTLAEAESQYRHLKWIAFLAVKGIALGITIMIAGFALGMVSDSLFYIWIAGALLFIASTVGVTSLLMTHNPLEQYQEVARAQREYTRSLRRYHDTLPKLGEKPQTAIEE